MRLRQAAGCGKRRLDRDPEKPFNLSKTLGLSTQSTYLDNKITQVAIRFSCKGRLKGKKAVRNFMLKVRTAFVWIRLRLRL